MSQRIGPRPAQARPGHGRYFLAVPVAGHGARRLAQRAAAMLGNDARLTHVADLHVTLCFFGMRRTVTLLRALEALDPHDLPCRFNVRVASIAAFAPTRGRHLVALPDPPSARRLADLQAAIPTGIRRLAPRSETRRRFLPHVTLARVRARDGRPPSCRARFRLLADRVALYRSTGRTGGPRYAAVRTWRLRHR